ncbi:hypothetical protein M7963_20385 [Enterobacter roggenkampii]|uniref:hypothetical protein n=1 Tax=Enterobacter cloacae complex TaxID=354276 RepID=UPI002005D88C|nr:MULTISPECIES: hypothetical protein [Enterobacter cloacae complex]MCK6745404.1 hypothetical protein [Enterobacter cloacae]MCK6785368.1 hypothetical protein [Enterobacter cloacae]MCW5003877.1 hypothetical protein [Enterobacter roggenkampii]
MKYELIRIPENADNETTLSILDVNKTILDAALMVAIAEGDKVEVDSICDLMDNLAYAAELVKCSDEGRLFYTESKYSH